MVDASFSLALFMVIFYFPEILAPLPSMSSSKTTELCISRGMDLRLMVSKF
jgi:hypothetical protein